MRVLQINKFYPFTVSGHADAQPAHHYPYGGTEEMMASVAQLLKAHGHEVLFFSMQHPDKLYSEHSDYYAPYMDFSDNAGIMQKIRAAGRILYSFEARKRLCRLLDDHPVDIAHIHSIQHQLSPSILGELKRRSIPMVMTLHDCKMVCPSYQMLKNGKICELCKGGKFYNCLVTKCHKGSFGKSLLVTLESYIHHNILKSYSGIRYYICPSKFIMHKVQEMGLHGNFVHLPHFVDVVKYGNYISKERDMTSGVYWGRLSREKGIMTLINAVSDIPIKITVIGDGPIKKEIEDYVKAKKLNNVKLLPHMNRENLLGTVSQYAFSVVPSECYEVFGMVIIEAFALGMPVIGAEIGGIKELIKIRENGLLFKPGSSDDLKEKILSLLNDPQAAMKMGQDARLLAETEYTPDVYYKRLIKIYESATAKKRR